MNSTLDRSESKEHCDRGGHEKIFRQLFFHVHARMFGPQQFGQGQEQWVQVYGQENLQRIHRRPA